MRMQAMQTTEAAKAEKGCADLSDSPALPVHLDVNRSLSRPLNIDCPGRNRD
jgi:hypothetical protein